MAQLELSEQEYHLFRDLIAERAGLYFDPAKQDLLASNLLKRMEDCGLGTFADYFQLLCSAAGTKEFDHLLNLITIPETYFFRDQAQFRALERFVIPELIEKKSHPALPLRIWSAGCSTGEEPYTIAMIVAAGIPGVVSSQTHILATDVNHVALEAARRGVYGPRSVRDVPEKYLKRFFTLKDGQYHLDDSIKQMVEFRHFNLISESYPPLEMSGWDIIFCRNVTIYFKPESTRRVIHDLYMSLKEGGYLFAGFSESLRYVSNEFDTVQVGGVFLYQKGATQKRQSRKARQTRRRRRLTSPLKQKPRIRSVIGKEAEETQRLCARAKEFLEMGQPEKASELLTPYLDKSTAPESVFLLLVEIALNQGELEKAAQLCERIIHHQPLSHAAHFLLGIVYWSWDDERRAIEAFEKVLSLKPEHALARFNLGDLYSQVGQLAKASLEYSNAMRLLKEVPDSFDEWFAGGFSPALLIDTCLSRLRTLDSEQKAMKGK